MSVILSEDMRIAATPFPCGRCYMCRKVKQRTWVHRILLEAREHTVSSFVTLTYNDDSLPEWGCLVKRDPQLFLKRLRKLSNLRIRYFLCGEYGGVTWRPHYHLILFGINDEALIKSAWSKGFTQCGELSVKTAYYVTKYAVKGMTYKKHKKLMEYGLTPEFCLASKGPPGGLGIGVINKIADRVKGMKYKPKVIRELHTEGHRLPLGRYLTEKLRERSGLLKSDYDEMFYNYQNGIFEKFNKEGECYRHNIREEKRVLREKIEHNDKINGVY